MCVRQGSFSNCFSLIFTHTSARCVDPSISTDFCLLTSIFRCCSDFCPRKYLHITRISTSRVHPLHGYRYLHSHSCRTALFLGEAPSHALLLTSFLDLALPTLLFALSFDLFALHFGFSEIYLLSTVFYCAFSQIIHRKVYLGLAKKL